MNGQTAVDEIPVEVPPLTRGWRMQMALTHGHRSVEHMAIKLGVSRSTVSRWINDKGVRQPRQGDMEIWARECRVPLEWLCPPEDGPTLVQVTLPYVPLKLAASTDTPGKSKPLTPMLYAVRDAQDTP